MNPKPINSEPEQYKVAAASTNPRVSVVPAASGKKLDKWRFEDRGNGKLVLVKHIGGEQYRANHTTPDAIPLVIRQALEAEGYEVVAPEETYLWVPRDDPIHDDLGAQIPVDAAGEPQWDEVSGHTEEWARPAVEG